MNKDRVLIFDTELISVVGHCFNASMRLAEAARYSDLKPIIFSNRHFEIVDERIDLLSHAAPFVDLETLDAAKTTIVPHFSSFAFDHYWLDNGRPVPLLRKMLQQKSYDARTFTRELYWCAERMDLSRVKAIYHHTFSAPMAEGWLRFFEELGDRDFPPVIAVIYLPPDQIQAGTFTAVDFATLLKAMRRKGFLGRRLHIVCETQGVRQAYLDHGLDFPVFVGPIPITETAKSKQPGPPKLRVGFLGEARFEKGFHLMPEIIRTVAQDKAAHQMEFHIQASSSRDNANWPGIERSKNELTALSKQYDNVHLYGSLSDIEYSVLMESLDLLILPYLPEFYGRRGSGVAYEALAMNKLILCSEDLDSADTFACESLLTVKQCDPYEFADKLIAIAADAAGPPSGSGALFARYGIARFWPELFKSVGLTTEPQAVPVARKTVLWIGVDYFEGGTGFVQLAQIWALRQSGARIIMLTAGWPGTGRHEGPERVARLQRDVWGEGGLLESLNGGYARYLEPIQSDEFEKMLYEMNEKFRYDPFTCGTYVDLAKMLEVPGELEKRILDDKPEIFCNYFFLMPIAEQLRAEGCRITCETHDFQAKQMVLRRLFSGKARPSRRNLPVEQQIDPFDVDVERHELRKADSLIHISEELSRQLDVGIPSVVLRPPSLKNWVRQDDIRSLGGAAEVIEASGPRDMPLAQPLINSLRADNVDSIGLLLFGTRHDANVIAAQEFVNEVFLPMFGGSELCLFVAGSLAYEFVGYDSAKVRLIGPVDDIELLILAARTVVLYVTEGTGFPTRTIELMQSGQCSVLNNGALRELAPAVRAAGVPTPENLFEVAADLQLLANSGEERVRRGKMLQDLANLHFSAEKYAAAVLGVVGLPGGESVPAMAAARHSEIGDPRRVPNGLLRLLGNVAGPAYAGQR